MSTTTHLKANAVLLGNEAAGLKPCARIRALASIGSEPTIILSSPAASRKALKNAGVNEAFASMVLEYMRELNIPSRSTAARLP